jgi:hypothetical protein
MNTTGRNLTLWKTRNMADLATAESKVIYTPPPANPTPKTYGHPKFIF